MVTDRPDINQVLSQMRDLRSQIQTPSANASSGMAQNGMQATQEVERPDFADMLKTAVDNVNSVQKEATSLAQAYERGEEVISTTDKRGVITYANPAFCRVAGFSLDELVGKNHNIVRHPDMPSEAFKDLWKNLSSGLPWRGVVKNRCKDGRYYWVDAFVTPIFEKGSLIGYQSVRTKLNNDTKQNAIKSYQAIKAGKSLNKWYESNKIKNVAYWGGSFALLFSALYSPYIMFIVPFLPFLIYKNELIDVPQYFKKLTNEYDSVSRLIYSGNKPQSIADFHLKVWEGKSNTI